MLGSGRRSKRACHQRVASNYIREYGLRRGFAHGEDDGGLIDFDLVRYVHVVSTLIPTKM